MRAIVVAGLVASTLAGFLAGSSERGPAVARAEQPSAEPPTGPTLNDGGPAVALPPLQRASLTPITWSDPTLQPGGAGSPAAGGSVPGESYFAGTGYYVGQGALWEFFSSHGGELTFGPPLSNVFTLDGRPVQIFRNHVLEVQPDGSVETMALLDSGAIPSTRLGRRTVPADDASLLAAAPATSTPNWSSAAQAFVQTNAPDVWNGLPVDFFQRYLEASQPPPASSDTALRVWGLPVSQVTPDPARPDLVHLRWERGVMEYNAATGRTQPVPLGELFRAVLTGEGLPAELAADVQGSPYYRQYNPSLPAGLARPELLPDSSLARAFEPNVVGGWPAASGLVSGQGSPLQASATPTLSTLGQAAASSPTPTLGTDACTGAEEMSYVPDRPRVGTQLLIAVTSTRRYGYPRLAGTERTSFVQERIGQLGFVYEWTVDLAYPGDHDYTFYIDSTIRCKQLSLEVRAALGASDSSSNDNFDSSNDNSDSGNTNDNFDDPTPTPRPDNDNNF